jgi:type II secretory pathway component GspD/PulD (secretin)
MLPHLLVHALLALAFLPATAQERSAVEQKRGAYVVKYAAAKDLASILAKHFKGAAEIQVGPENTSNCLLVNATPTVFDEVVKTLEKLDRRPHSIAVEIFVVELPRHKIDDQDNRPQEKDFSGTIDELPRSLEAMMKNGHVAGFKRLQLTTLEGQVGSLMQTERKPFATSATTTTYLDVGTRIKVTPQVTADGSVTLDLSVQDNRDRDSSDQPGKPEFIMTSLAGKISVASGKAVLAKDAKVISKGGKGETLVVVGARIAESEAKPR